MLRYVECAPTMPSAPPPPLRTVLLTPAPCTAPRSQGVVPPLQRYYGTHASNLATSPPEPHQVRARRLRLGEEAMPEPRRQRCH